MPHNAKPFRDSFTFTSLTKYEPVRNVDHLYDDSMTDGQHAYDQVTHLTSLK